MIHVAIIAKDFDKTVYHKKCFEENDESELESMFSLLCLLYYFGKKNYSKTVELKYSCLPQVHNSDELTIGNSVW